MGDKGSHRQGASPVYAEAGVDIDAAGKTVPLLARLAKTTYGREVLSGVGGFAGLFDLGSLGLRQPVLVSGADGVGTKLKVAQQMGVLDTVGIDCVAMNVDDVVCVGAKPLFFLDYIALGKHDRGLIEQLVRGLAEGCSRAGCALLGGETAQMPGFYDEGEFELAGFAVGVVERDRIVDGSEVRPGDAIVGLASSGLHSNGYSLVRRVLLEQGKLELGQYVPDFGRTLGEELLEPTRIYAPLVTEYLSRYEVHGIAHITGGGIFENIPRILPESCQALLRRGTWEEHSVFGFIQHHGRLSDEEMFRTFNMGIGMTLIVPPDSAEACAGWFEQQGIRACVIGEIRVSRDAGRKSVEVEGLR
ncbi:MAG TPA: phosphoribosylformylglycinamidine cyclo-ligase [Firmicutes bacterium]|nr:phosphoribosylformylglycinamidine cyclo-ligase [Bacillota bacterium]